MAKKQKKVNVNPFLVDEDSISTSQEPYIVLHYEKTINGNLENVGNSIFDVKFDNNNFNAHFMQELINKKISLIELIFANLAIIGLTYGLEKVWLLRHESQKIILYDNINLIQAGKQAELKADLESRTGIKINRVEIGKIDFLRDTALLKIYFYDDEQHAQIDESFSQNINA